jgi:hypothetical protein
LAGEPVTTKHRHRRNRRASWTPMTVNGPEDVALDWDATNWRNHEDNVRRLRGRIFTATKDAHLNRPTGLTRKPT